MTTENQTYTLTIYDSDPCVSGPCAWDEEIEIEAEDLDEAISLAQGELDSAVIGLEPRDGYRDGQTIYANLEEDSSGVIVATLTTTVSI